jgi:hypothetical protein
MRHRTLALGTLGLALLIAAPVSRADEDKLRAFDLRVQVDAEDRIYHTMQGVEITGVTIGETTVAAARTEIVLDQIAEVQEVHPGGRIKSYVVQTPRHGAVRISETAQGKQTKPDPRAGVLHGSEVRYELGAGKYTGRPVAGVTTRPLVAYAQQPRTDALWGEYLPNSALCVGGSEEGSSGILLRQIAKDLDGRATPKGKLKLTLERVNQVSRPRTAHLLQEYSVEIQVGLDAQTSVTVPIDCRTRIVYDLDSGHVAEVEVRADGKVKQQMHGREVVVDVEINQDHTFQRIAPSWTYQPQKGSAPTCETLSPEFDDRDWTVGHHVAVPGPTRQSITEWVLPGQNVKAWSELVTVQSFHGLPATTTPEQMMTNTRDRLLKVEPQAKWTVLRKTPTEAEYWWSVHGSDANADQVEVARIVKGKEALHLVRYTVKQQELDDGDPTLWLTRMRRARLTTGY